MAAELPYASDPNHKPAAAAAAAAARTATTRCLTWLRVGILVFMALNFVLCVRRVYGDRRDMAFVVGSHLNLALLFFALRRFEVSPEGSPARRRARLAVWLLTTTLTAVFTWRVGEELPLAFAAAAWVLAAANVAGGFYFYALFLRDEDEQKRSDESLI